MDWCPPLSMEFSRQEYWSGLPFPSPGNLPNPGIEPGSPALQANSLLTDLQGKPINPEKTVIHKDIHTPKFTVALFIIVRT